MLEDNTDRMYSQVVGFRNNADMHCDVLYRRVGGQAVFEYNPTDTLTTFLEEKGIYWTITDDEAMFSLALKEAVKSNV